jgi:hypothetical protein
MPAAPVDHARWPLVSVLVLNYNGKRFLKACLDSLQAAAYPNFEIVLIDNCSTDDSALFVEQNYPHVRILQTGSNAGYSRAYNLAFRSATGKYFVLLNNDVEVTPQWLDHLVAAAEADPHIAALQPKLLSLQEKSRFEYAGASGGFMDFFGFPFLRGRVLSTMEIDEGQYDDAVEVFWTSGAAMFVRAEALNLSGDLDEDFVHHMEEIDLCWRLHLAGFKLKVIPAAVIYHYAGATITPDSFKKLYWNFRNSIFMLIKNFESKNLWRSLSVRYLIDAFALLASLLKLDFKMAFAIAKAHAWLILNWRLIAQKRRETQARRRVSDQAIVKLLYPGSILIAYFLKRKKTYLALQSR